MSRRNAAHSPDPTLDLFRQGSPAGPPLEDKLRSELAPPRPPGPRSKRRERGLPRGSHQKVRERAFYPSFDGQRPGVLAEPALPGRIECVDPQTGEVFPRSSPARLAEARQRALKSTTIVDWDASGNCQHPYQRMFHTPAEPSKDGKPALPAMKTYSLHPCRQCRACRSSKAASWFSRMTAECSVASGNPRQRCARTWLVTLTMDPEWHDYIRLKAIAAFNDSGKACRPGQHRTWEDLAPIEYEELPERERLRLLHKEYRKELKLFYDRVRQRLKTRFRHVCVTEKHGGPGLNYGHFHWHVLMHEVPGYPQLKQDIVEDCWISQLHGPAFWLTQPRQTGRFVRRALRVNAEAGRICSMSVVRDPVGVGRYALKYVVKEPDSYIQASKRYGRNVDGSLMEPVQPLVDGDAVPASLL